MDIKIISSEANVSGEFTQVTLEITATPAVAIEVTRKLLSTEQQADGPDLDGQIRDRDRRIAYLEDQVQAGLDKRETLARAVSMETDRADAADAKLAAIRKAVAADTSSAARLLTVMGILDQKEPLA